MPDNIMKIKLQVQNQKANKQLQDTSTNIKDIEKKAKNSKKELGRMRIATAGLRRTMGALRNNLLLVSFAFGTTMATLAKTVKAYGEQELAEKKLETALGHTSQSLLDQASALQSVTTFGDENIIQAQALIAAFTDDEEAIKRATAATLDLAAAKGMDLFAAADLVAKTLGSSTNAMSRYGIEVTGAVGSTERLNTLTQNIANTFGGQATAQAQTLTGSLSQMGNAVGDAAESIGGLLAPAVIVTSGVIKTMAEELQKVISFHDDLARVAAMDVVGVLTTEEAAVSDLTRELENMTKKDIVNRLSSMFDGMSVMAIEKEMENLQNMMTGIGESSFELDTSTALFNDTLTHQFDLLKLLIDAYETAPEGITAYEEKYQEFITTQLTALSNYEQEQKLIADFILQYEDEAKALGLVTDATKLKNKEDEKQKKSQLQTIQNNIKLGQSYANAIQPIEAMGDAAVASLTSQASAHITTAVADWIQKFLATTPLPPFISGPLAIAGGAAFGSAMGTAIQGIKGVEKAQYGMDTTVSSPTLILAGENNQAESVQITPLEGPNLEGPQGAGAITLNISAPLVDDTVVDRIIPSIREAVRRGEDLGFS